MSKVLVDREVVAQVVDAAFSPNCSQRLGELVPSPRAALKQDPALLQEPVYYRSPTGSGDYKYSRFSCALDNPEPLYAVPQPARQPVLEPVGYVESSVRGVGGFHCRLLSHTMPPLGAKLYASPPDADALLRNVMESLTFLISTTQPMTGQQKECWPSLEKSLASLRKHLGETT